MSDGLATTFRTLSKTENESAVRVLLPVLDSPYQSIQDGALEALLTRRNPAGQVEILRRFPSMSQHWKHIIRQHPGRLTGTLRDAILGPDDTLCQNACKGAVMFGNYDLIPTLLTAVEDTLQLKADLATTTLMELVGQLYNEIAHGDEDASRTDRQWVGQHIVSCLEASVQRFGRHRRREVIEAFLMLASSDNVALNEILENPHHVSYLVLIDVMSRSPHEKIMNLLLDYLDDPQMPSAIQSVAANRCDLKFIKNLLYKVGREPSPIVRQNLKRMVIIAWLKNIKNIINDLDDAAQHSLVQLALSSGVTRAQLFSLVEFVLLKGKPGGRRQASLALNDFTGADSNSLAMKALNDSDPHVQANLLRQLRHRGIPGVLSKLVEMLDSPHLVVRQAAREALSEFTFARFLGTFDMMEDDARLSTGALVKKVDQQTIPLLCDELRSAVRSRRLRGLQVVRIMDVADQLEELLIDMLKDEDHILRAEVVTTLGNCRSIAARKALQQALHDRSTAVQEAAQRSINQQYQ